jgi:predicted nucleic acid-binding protein
MVFIDTGAFIARYLVRDQFHEDALLKWQALEESNAQCITSNFVLDETLTLLGRMADYHFALEKAKILYASKSLTILRPGFSEELKALSWFEKYSDQRVSFTDCVSFVLMREAKAKQAFSFDQHFSRAGFQLF